MKPITGKFLTTNQAGRLAGVSGNTVRVWADTGLIAGCYKLPGGHRRIPRAGLLSLLKSAKGKT